MLIQLLSRPRQLVTTGVQQLLDQLRSWSKPPRLSRTVGLIYDLVRTKPQLVLENAWLRQQRIVLNRSVKRPCFTPADRERLILLASRLPSWRETLLIVKPETLLRWHREGFRRF